MRRKQPFADSPKRGGASSVLAFRISPITKPTGWRMMSMHDQIRLQRGYLHEVRIDEEGLECCVALGPAGDAARRLIGESVCLWVFWARCHFDAMNVYYGFLRRGTYKSDEPRDLDEYPPEWYTEQEAHLATICIPAFSGLEADLGANT